MKINTSQDWSRTAEHKRGMNSESVSYRERLRQKQLERTPQPQAYYVFDGRTWRAAAPSTDTWEISAADVILVTWNIDFMASCGPARMKAALDHLRSTVLAQLPTPKLAVVLFQEMTQSDVELLQGTPWVRDHFYMTDNLQENWAWRSEIYGTTTLIDRRVTIKNVSRLYYIGEHCRDALFVDLQLFCKAPGTQKTQAVEAVFRVCNTHLESLASNPPLRPTQMEAASRYLHADGVYAGVLAGDMNANQPLDGELPRINDLRDAYIETGGSENDPAGHTWGYHGSPWRKGHLEPKRLDKVLICGAITAEKVERVGVGLEVVDEEAKGQLTEEQAGLWVSDHYGLAAELRINGAVLPIKENVEAPELRFF